ncbi:MAG: heavy metal-responsive transcriptional regulator [Actinomycetota bacterium]|nr:heavy metal-responsive transcriptional regulator [Actinomycetota bacterium]
MHTGELAQAVGVNVETLRYYERRGLLAAPPRHPSGYRDYPVEAVARLRLIKQAQSLGLSLDEITGLLALSPDPVIACGDLATRVRSKITELDEKLAALTELRGSLDRLLCDCCGGQQDGRACPVLARHTPI